MLQINVGHGSVAAADMVPVSVSVGETVTVTNTDDEIAVDYFLDGVNGDPTELDPGESVDLTAPSWLQVVGNVGSVALSGGMYGDAPPDDA